MGKEKPKHKLKKELRLFGVYAIATGTTLSAGFFLLPGLAAVKAGPAMVLSYLLAAIPLVPAMFSIIELATAMPRAGGMYYFLDRTLGPMFGTIGGVGTWLALLLKVSFALVGMGAYIQLFIPQVPMWPVEILIALILGVINIYGVKKSGKLQVYLVIGLLALLLVFIADGFPQIDPVRFEGFWDAGSKSIIYTTGLVYISYVGVTNVASLSEEVRNPEKNLPRGVILAMSTAIVIYGFGISVMIGVVPMDELAGNLTPVAAAGERILGKTGAVLLSFAALLAFISVANAGTMSASRYPLAMSRDNLLPHVFRSLSEKGTPMFSIIVTVGVIVIILLTMDPTGIAKLASAFQLLMFAFICLAVIVIRESGIQSYDPGYKSPLYPWMQLVGIVTSLYLIVEMGLMPMLFSMGLIFIGIFWYMYYVKKRIVRAGAIFHVFEKLGRSRYEGLDAELRGILKEKGLRKEDPFDEIVSRALVLDYRKNAEFADVVSEASEWFCRKYLIPSEKIKKMFLEGTKIGATPVTKNIALPHLKLEGIEHPEMVLVRSAPGIDIIINDPLTDNENELHTVNAIFFLVSPENNPTQHLRILAKIAGKVEEESFEDDWYSAQYSQDLKELLLRDEKFLTVKISRAFRSSKMIGESVKDLKFPEGCLIAMLRRQGETIIPKGNTILQEQDRLTIIGDVKSLREFEQLYGEK